MPAQEWVESKWNGLPNTQDLHWCRKYRSSWKGVNVVTPADLPIPMRHHPLVVAFDNYPFLPKVKTIKEKPRIEGVFATAPHAEMSPKIHRYNPKHIEGKAAIFAVCDGRYSYYAPLFAYSARQAYPDYDVVVAFRAPLEDAPMDLQELTISEVADLMPKEVKIIPFGSLAPYDPYTTAALRFAGFEKELKDYDFVLITDIDMLIYREELPIVDQHMMHLEHDGTICYENWITETDGDAVRMPGVHFITRAWWERTAAARAVEAEILEERGADSYCYDEYLIGRIVRKSNLPYPPHGKNAQVKMWRHHGVHLGDWRINQDRNFKPRPNVFQGMHIQKLLKDEHFMNIARTCGEHIPLINDVVQKWPMLFRG